MVEVLKYLYQENDKFDALIDRMFKLRGAMFVKVCQYLFARTIIRYPKSYASSVQAEDNSHVVFQERKDIPSMRDFLVDHVMRTKMPLPVTFRQRRNLHVFDGSPAGPSTLGIDTSGEITQWNKSLPRKDYQILSQVPSGDSNSTEETTQQLHHQKHYKRKHSAAELPPNGSVEIDIYKNKNKGKRSKQDD